MEKNALMRIAILSDAYLPESTLNHAKMLHELAVELRARGHDVVVITPGTVVQPSLINRFNLDGVDVWKFRCRPTREVSHLKRAINETLLSWYALKAIKREGLKLNFDLVINYSPTIFFGPLVKWFRHRGAFVYLVLRDFFPQWAIDEGLIKSNSLTACYFRLFEHFNYSVSDVIAVQSPANISVFKQMTHAKNYPVQVLYNWAAPVISVDFSFGASFIEKYKLNEKFLFFYGGNIGHAQDIPYILRLAAKFREHPEAHFLIIGQGDQYEKVGEKIRVIDLYNTTLAPSVNQEEYLSLLTQVHVGIFTLRSSHRAHNFPGKILGYLAAGLPILGAVNFGNDLIEMVNQSGSGKVSVNGNFEQFYEDALNMMYKNHERKAMSIASQRLLEEFFSVSSAADQILNTYTERRKVP